METKKTTSFMLRKAQFARLKKSRNVNATITSAIKRYLHGDFQIDRNEDSIRNEKLVLVPFYGQTGILTSHEIRLIVDAHLATRMDWLDGEIRKAKAEADTQWAKLRAKGPVIISEDKQ